MTTSIIICRSFVVDPLLSVGCSVFCVLSLIHDAGGIFEGEWRDEQKQGKGMYYFPSGERYEGEFTGDSMVGRGRFSYKNGDLYEGAGLPTALYLCYVQLYPSNCSVSSTKLSFSLFLFVCLCVWLSGSLSLCLSM